jgi:hypothetical protein
MLTFHKLLASFFVFFSFCYIRPKQKIEGAFLAIVSLATLGFSLEVVGKRVSGFNGAVDL